MRLWPLLMLLSCLCSGHAAAGDESFLERYAETYRFRLGRPTRVQPAPDGKTVLFLRSGPRSFVRNLYEFDVASGKERLLVTATQLLDGSEEKLTAEERARRERMRLAARGIASFELSEDGRRILIPLSGRLFVVERSSGSVSELPDEGGPAIDPRFSPDAKRVACVREGELFVIDVDRGRQKQLTRGAGGSVTHGLSEFVAQEEMSRHHGFWWSPDSRRLVYQQTDTEGLEIMNIMDATRPERAPATWPYPRPGKRNASVRLGIVSAKGGSTTWIDWDREAYEYLAVVRWAKNAPLTLLVQNRTQTEQRLLAVDPRDGTTSTLLVERDEAWVEIDQVVPLWLADGSGFLWTTDRRGFLEVELRNRDGSLKHVVTPSELAMRRLAGYRPKEGEVLVEASRDPTESHLYLVPLDPARGGPRRLTHEPGLHRGTLNASGTLYVDSASTLTGESWSVVDLRHGSEHRLTSVAEQPGLEPRLEFTTVGDDPSFHAVVVRPRDFVEDRKYPVIVHVYGGPTSQMVLKSSSRYLLDQWMADQGYVVVAIDGRGTPHRGSRWWRVVKDNLARIPLDDQVRALALLVERYQELDTSRVGIYGWSFGGYLSAMAAMRAPDSFRAAVAGAPVVDWEDYDTHYTERYMDLPQDNAEGYRDANVLTFADRLERPLLLIHGTADDNVYFMHSLKLADALFRAGKPFEFLPLPGFTHMVPDPLVSRRLYTRIMDFFELHLAPRPSAR